MESKARPALERLAKWRTVFASWQLGTRSNTDEELKAVKDHREVTIILRAEVTAVTAVLFAKGIITEVEFDEALAKEAELLNADFEKRFPGFQTDSQGVRIDVAKAHQTTKNWPK